MNIQSLFKTIGDNGCLALCYLQMIGVTDLDKVPVIARAIDKSNCVEFGKITSYRIIEGIN